MEIIITPTDEFREIRSINIYSDNALPFREALNPGSKMELDPSLLILSIKNIIPGDYSREIKPKNNTGNRYYEIAISIDLYDLSTENIKKINELFNYKGFVVETISNTERLVVGSDGEPLTIDIIDNTKEDDKGEDFITISIIGDCIAPPYTEVLK